MLTALQGIVNRQQPRLYLQNPTNPAGYDASVAGRNARRHGYTGQRRSAARPCGGYRTIPQRDRGCCRLVSGTARVRLCTSGCRLDCTMCCLRHLKAISRFELPVVEDLRGRWRCAMSDAYRYVFDWYWDHMVPARLGGGSTRCRMPCRVAT